jgi:hypothetical protein
LRPPVDLALVEDDRLQEPVRADDGDDATPPLQSAAVNEGAVDNEVAALVRATIDGDDEAGERLANLAGSDAARVTPALAGLFAAGILYPPEVYRAADDRVRRRLVGAIDAGAGGEIGATLDALAHAGGPIAEDAFRRWSRIDPPDVDRLRAPLLNFALGAGWTLEPIGARRLSGSVAFALVPAEAPAHASGQCPWCRSPLWTALDVDTADPRVAAALEHAGWSGRLRFETCYFCACYATMFAAVAPDGSCRWSELTERPPFLGPSAEEEPSQVVLAVGDRRESPYDASAWDARGSTLGGYPDWIQSAEYVRCPACREFMDHVALIGGSDLSEFGEGAYYVSLHAGCGLAAVRYQQS